MSKTIFLASAALAALALAYFAGSYHAGSIEALAAAAPPTTFPNAVVANPPTAARPATPPAAAAAAPATRPAIAPNAVVANPGAAAPAAGAATAAATPRMIVIDRNFILQRSAAGRDMLAQATNLSRTAETQFKNEETQLVTEAQQVQQQLAILAPDARAAKEKEFTTKQQAFQTRVQTRQAEIQAGFNKAARDIEVALEPILKAIMVERGANMVVDRSVVILSTVDIDVTPDAVQRLDKALPKVKVELTPVPPGSVPALAARGGAIATPAAAKR